MTAFNSHFVFGTTAAFSHVPPVISLALALLTSTPDLVISILLHKNNEENSLSIIEGTPQDVVSRLKLVLIGEKTEWNSVSLSYIQMMELSGGEYAKILAASLSITDCAPWPTPTVFIGDYTSFFFIPVKTKVEENFPHLKPAKFIGYNPQMAAEALLCDGAEENGSLRWVDKALAEFDSEAVVSLQANQLLNGKTKSGDDKIMPPEEQAARMIKAYRACVTESKHVVKIPGWTPFHVSELWSLKIDWTQMNELAWFQWLSGRQAMAQVPEAWISCFPSSVFEPETIAAARKDEYITNGGKKPYFEVGWFERKPKANWGEGVKEFLDKYEAKSVVYISFGTVVNAGFGLPVIFDYLEQTKTPYIYACGNQYDSLPQHVKDTLAKSQAQGFCIAPNWVDQVGILSHKSVKAFVSHCGVNSALEGILAGVPIVSWGRRGDQVLLASIIHHKGLGVELLQHREGSTIGHATAHRPEVTVTGKPEDLKAELAAAFEKIGGPEGDKMREKANALATEIRAKRTGDWEETIKLFGQFGRE
ncbi:hypothetical protein L198_03654 [Cryptococcus wingfieldii CBS 7118]|uniref:UDP-glycosyltransferases domain-containing protein n=1 Tax=Cryptococcus wingfieldii CBS 7118 TaxID=1295528 RepID=A0A1E3JC01_9TREE|nr:hypothetical protein L198_03654 [Cryptococcus wingfieldii CBS 7118]ODN98410.1 hypothetical protein L198_03654 [Cryptococcus wingfieldii CBS 7118]